jgi:hypothetical protein
MRIRCWILGCGVGSEPFEGHCCETCNADLYAGDFRQLGCRPVEWLRSLLSWWRSRQYFLRHQCEVCKKNMWFTEEGRCSPECLDKWLPF